MSPSSSCSVPSTSDFLANDITDIRRALVERPALSDGGWNRRSGARGAAVDPRSRWSRTHAGTESAVSLNLESAVSLNLESEGQSEE